MADRIGLCVITFQRPAFLKRCLESLEKNNWGGATERIVVIDEPMTEEYFHLINEACLPGHLPKAYGAPNGGCAVAKNRAFKELLQRGCTHIFLMEDDQVMIDPETCHKYIAYATEHGLHHMNFAHHGNQAKLGWYMELKGVHCYPDCVGAFTYYTAECLLKVGFHDENFKNAFEHVELTYRIANAGMTLPFWFFADHPDSRTMLQEQVGALEDSVIRGTPGWTKHVEWALDYWTRKHGKPLLPRADLKKIAEDPTSGLLIKSKRLREEKKEGG